METVGVWAVVIFLFSFIVFALVVIYTDPDTNELAELVVFLSKWVGVISGLVATILGAILQFS